MKTLPTRPRTEDPKHPFACCVEYQGVVLDMEQAPGDYREGVDDDGQPWRVRIPHYYGEVRGTKGADGDPVDVILKADPNPFATYVYVVQTKAPGSKRFDEVKCMLGFDTQAEAVRAFRANYNRRGFYQGVTRWPIGAWKAAMERPRVQGGTMRMVLKKGSSDPLVDLVKGRRHVKQHMRRLKSGKIVPVQQYEQDGRDSAVQQPRAPRSQRPAEEETEHGGLVTAAEAVLPKKARQPKARDEEDLFAEAEKAMGLQAMLLNEGQGLDRALGNALVVRGDKGEKNDEPTMHDGPIILIAPIKERDRSREKVASKYDGDWSQLGDVVRATVSVPSYDRIPEVMQKLRALGMEMAAKPDDKFTNPTVAGYRDLSLTVRYGDHIGELQIHVHPILAVKKQAHKLYEKTRTIEAKMKTEGRKAYQLNEWHIVTKANQEMARLFGDAWAETLQDKPGGAGRLRKLKAKQMQMAKSANPKGPTRHFDWEGDHVEWTPGRVPTHVRPDGHRIPIYDMQRFYMNARELHDGPKMLMKARPTQGALEAHGQMGLFGGGKATVKAHARKTKSGKIAQVQQHQRKRQPSGDNKTLEWKPAPLPSTAMGRAIRSEILTAGAILQSALERRFRFNPDAVVKVNDPDFLGSPKDYRRAILDGMTAAGYLERGKSGSSYVYRRGDAPSLPDRYFYLGPWVHPPGALAYSPSGSRIGLRLQGEGKALRAKLTLEYEQQNGRAAPPLTPAGQKALVATQRLSSRKEEVRRGNAIGAHVAQWLEVSVAVENHDDLQALMKIAHDQAVDTYHARKRY